MDVQRIELSYQSVPQPDTGSDEAQKLKVHKVGRFRRLHEYNVAVLGAAQAGQTALVRRLLEKRFVRTRHSKHMEYNILELADRNVKLHFFDLCGNHTEAELALNLEVIKNSQYAIIVFSLANLNWQQIVSNQILQVRSLNKACLITLFGNKSDLRSVVDRDAVTAYAQRHRLSKVIFGSAKTGENVEELLNQSFIDDYTFARLNTNSQKKPECAAQ